MFRCSLEVSDVVIDGLGYRIESPGELRRLEHCAHLRGISFTNFAVTRDRLKQEEKKQKKEARKQWERVA